MREPPAANPCHNKRRADPHRPVRAVEVMRARAGRGSRRSRPAGLGRVIGGCYPNSADCPGHPRASRESAWTRASECPPKLERAWGWLDRRLSMDALLVGCTGQVDHRLDELRGTARYGGTGRSRSGVLPQYCDTWKSIAAWMARGYGALESSLPDTLVTGTRDRVKTCRSPTWDWI